MRRAAAIAILLLAAPLVGATHPDGKSGASLGGATVPHQPILRTMEAETFAAHDGSGQLVANATASGGQAWMFETYGGIEDSVTLANPGVTWFRLFATGWHADGVKNPHMHIYIDGEQRGEFDVRAGWGPYEQTVPLTAGTHKVRIENFNNYRDNGTAGPTSERTLLVDKLEVETPTLVGTPRLGAGSSVTVVSAEIHAAVTGQLQVDATALSGQSWWQWGIGCFAELWVADAPMDVTLAPRLRGTTVNDIGSHVVVTQDGAVAGSYFVGDDWAIKPTRLSDVAPGAHTLHICYDNDEPGAKRNLYLDQFSLTASGSPATAGAWTSAHGGLDNARYAAGSALTPLNAAGVTKLWSIRASGLVTGTPAVADGIVYFGDGGGKIHAVRLGDGSAVWTVDHHAPIDSSVAISDDAIIFGDAKGNLTSVARSDGHERWRVQADPVPGTHLYGSPVPYQGRVYIGIASQQTLLEYTGQQDFRGGVAAFDLATGAQIWRTYTAPETSVGVSVWSTPAIDPDLGLLFVGSGNAYAAPSGSLSDALIALRLVDGSVAWSYQATPGDTFNGRGSPGPDRDLGASPNLFEIDGRKVVGDGDKGGTYYVLDRATGTLLYASAVNFAMPGTSPAQNEGFLGTAAVRQGVIFAPTTARSMIHALDARSGDELWSQELGPFPLKYGDRMFGAASVAEGVVVQGTSAGRVFLLDAANGTVLANLSAGGAVQGGISVVGDTLLVPDVGQDLWTGGGGLTAFRVPGTVSSPTVQPPTPISSTPVASTPEMPTPEATTPPAPTSETPIVVTKAPEAEHLTEGAGAARAPTPMPPLAWLMLGAAGAALATRARARR